MTNYTLMYLNKKLENWDSVSLSFWRHFIQSNTPFVKFYNLDKNLCSEVLLEHNKCCHWYEFTIMGEVITSWFPGNDGLTENLVKYRVGSPSEGENPASVIYRLCIFLWITINLSNLHIENDSYQKCIANTKSRAFACHICLIKNCNLDYDGWAWNILMWVFVLC